MRWFRPRPVQESVIEKMTDDELMDELHALDEQKQAIRARQLLIHKEHTKRVEERKNPAGIEIHL